MRSAARDVEEEIVESSGMFGGTGGIGAEVGGAGADGCGSGIGLVSADWCTDDEEEMTKIGGLDVADG